MHDLYALGIVRVNPPPKNSKLVGFFASIFSSFWHMIFAFGSFVVYGDLAYGFIIIIKNHGCNVSKFKDYEIWM